MTTDRSANVVSIEDQGLTYRIRILITHPVDRLDRLTAETGFSPQLLSGKGDQRINRAGALLPGTHEFSTWSYWEEFRDSRKFSVGFRRIVDALIPAGDSLRGLRSTGGRVLVILELKGHRNIGDVIKAHDLSRLVQIGADFGIEVFPSPTSSNPSRE